MFDIVPYKSRYGLFNFRRKTGGIYMRWKKKENRGTSGTCLAV
jgi:hypothetical protein